MILVTLGTQDKAFPRLLEAIEKQLKKGTINDEVIVQAGCTAFESEQMKLFDLIPMEQFDELLARCDLLITHGGVGTIMAGLRLGKKIIAAPGWRNITSITTTIRPRLCPALSSRDIC